MTERGALLGLGVDLLGLLIFCQTAHVTLCLILSDCVLGSIWSLISLMLGVRTYNFFGIGSKLTANKSQLSWYPSYRYRRSVRDER